MLIAAMVLGIIGGIAFFIGGGAETIYQHENNVSVPWWIISLMPVGVIGAIGGALVRWKPSAGGMLLLLASAAAIAIGFVSYEEFVQDTQLWPILPLHPLMGLNFYYLPLPLFMLIIGGVLALAGGKKAESEVDN